MESIYFNEEHARFRDHVRAFFKQEVAARDWERERRIPRQIWKKMGELGYLGINFPETYGGSEADFFFSAVFLEEVGRTGLGGFAAAVGVQQYMATSHIFKFGSEDLKQRYLTPSIRGEKIGALAVSEPDAGSDVNAIRTKAVREGDVFVVNGSKTFITNGVHGDFATVAVKTGAASDGVSLLVIDRDAAGFSARKLEKMGWHCSDTAEMAFEDVRVPVANLVGQENMGFYYIMECFQLERLVAALTAIGGADACLELTLDYIRRRQAFGKPIARFQAIRHRLADLQTEMEAARQLTYHACWLHERGQHAVKECSMVKLKATELGKTIADECLQFFGGYGYMEEYPLATMYRDARAGTLAGGTSEIMREILAKIIIDGVQYQAPSHGGEASQSEEQDPEKPDVADIFQSLPRRYQGDADLNLRVHFDFESDASGKYTVGLEKGKCTVSEGIQGEADCLVTSAGAVYRDIELGVVTPEAAFMAGKIHVTRIPVMMKFIKLFKKRDHT